MAFVDIPTLDGSPLHLQAGAVYRITRSTPDDQGSVFTKVDYAGAYQLTREDAASIAALLKGAGAKLGAFTAPDGTPLYLAVGAITVVGPSDPNDDPPGSQAVVTVAGHHQAVAETEAQVEAIMNAAA